MLLGLTAGRDSPSAERVAQVAAGFNFFALPMLVYQLDTKLKSGFDLLRRNFSRSVSAFARIVEIKQSIGVRLRNPMIVDRGRHKRGHGLNRPGRALQARLEPIFDGLIAEHHNVVMGQTPARPAAQSPA